MPGDRVAMLANNSDRYVEFYFATLWAGGAGADQHALVAKRNGRPSTIASRCCYVTRCISPQPGSVAPMTSMRELLLADAPNGSGLADWKVSSAITNPLRTRAAMVLTLHVSSTPAAQRTRERRDVEP
jgi:hypothetical protein